MNRFVWLSLGLSLLCGCDIPIPNGVFKCGDDADCPGGFTCDAEYCYDADCEDLSWEDARQTIHDTYASVGDEPPKIECGELPDECGRPVEGPACDQGETCNSFMCGCQQSCEGVECGMVERGCSGGDPIDCGACLGGRDCVDGRCECPLGRSCDAGCPGGCANGEICVDGNCCTQQFPCRDNACSPPGGLPDGCGGVVHCEPCDAALGLECARAQGVGAYTCVNCCDQQGRECGSCSGVLCGTCAANESCEAGKCVTSADVCGDFDEPNDSKAAATDLCNGTCSSKSWTIEHTGASLRDARDEDHFVLKVPDSLYYSLHARVTGLSSTREIRMEYSCANGRDGVDDCSGSSSSNYCIEDGKNELALYRKCSGSGPGTLHVIVSSKEGEYLGPCDDYSLTVWAQYFDYDD